jgi:hypothetical protein
MLPMDEVGTHGVMPASTTEATVKKYVVLSLKKSWCARIADKARLGKQVVLRP